MRKREIERVCVDVCEWMCVRGCVCAIEREREKGEYEYRSTIYRALIFREPRNLQLNIRSMPMKDLAVVDTVATSAEK